MEKRVNELLGRESVHCMVGWCLLTSTKWEKVNLKNKKPCMKQCINVVEGRLIYKKERNGGTASI